ncbi:MAG: lysophospholipase [Burkholderiaceae bacterium]|nr:lysophospholipase [Burkholderiaceae bacterium]
MAMLLKVGVAAALSLAFLAVFQHRLLYFPDRAPLEALLSERLRPWPGAEDFRGLLAEPPGAARATAIVFHGNAGHAGHRAHYAQALAPFGVRVLLAEYPGYGPRDGELGEASLVADAASTIEHAHAQFGAPLVLIGESLGAGVAAAAAARQRERIAALMLITPWDRLESVAAHHYPWLPVTWLLRDRYDSVRHLAAFGRPVLVAVAERDDIVPARFGRALFESLPPPKRLSTIERAGHNDWLLHVDAAWWRAALAFLLPAAP